MIRTFSLEQRHIDGADHTSTNCPYARCLKEATGKDVVVYPGLICFLAPYPIYTPMEIRRDINAYDCGGVLKPKEFELQF